MKKRIILITVCLTLLLALVAMTACESETQKIKPDDGYYVAEDMTFTVSSGTIVLQRDISSLLNKNKSKIRLTTDGQITLEIITTDLISQIANLVIKNIQGVDLTAGAEMYAEGLFPGFTFDDLKRSFQNMTDSIGLEVVGLDFDSEMMKELTTSLSETGTIPDSFSIPRGFGLKYTGRYYIRDFTSYDGTVYKGVYCDNLDFDTDSFLFLTLDDSGEKASISARIEVLGAILYAVE